MKRAVNKTRRRYATLGVVAFMLAGMIGLWSPAFAAPDPGINFTDPPTASQYTNTILIRGNGWGPYDKRGEPTVSLYDEEGQTLLKTLTVEKNYRDCSFSTNTGSCVMDEDDMLLRVLLPAGLQQRNYIVFVKMANGMGAMYPFSVVALPDFHNANRPIVAITPQSGPVNTYVLLTLGGFPKRTGLLLRFDGLKMKGTPVTDANGNIDEYGFWIPSYLRKPDGLTGITFAPGKHELRVDTGAGLFQTVAFTITDKEEPKKEEPKKEEPKKEEPKKEEPKKEEPKKEEPKNDKPFEGKACDPNLPRVWQEGCVDKNAKQAPAKVEVYVPDSQGKPCKEGVAITFQPGCVSVEKPTEAFKPFAGKACDSNLPRVWQDGCVDKKKEEQQTSTTEYYVPDSAGKPCKEGVAITFQPGCVPQKQDTSTTTSSSTKTDSSATQIQRQSTCNPLIPTYAQPSCTSEEKKTTQQVAEQKTAGSEKPFAGKSCDPNLPRVWQEGCVTKQTEKQSESDVIKKVEAVKKNVPEKVELVKLKPIKSEKIPSSDSKTQQDYNEAYQKNIQLDAYKKVLNLGSGIY